MFRFINFFTDEAEKSTQLARSLRAYVRTCVFFLADLLVLVYKYLEVKQIFHRYSLRNVMLLYKYHMSALSHECSRR